YVKAVRVALNSREPLVTRVVMDITPAATYHVERTGADGRDLAVVFEGPHAGDAPLIPPATPGARPKDDDEKYTMEQALANGAPLVPRGPLPARVPPPTPPAQTPSGAPKPAQTQPPAPAAPALPPAQTPPPQNPPPAGQSTFTSEVPGSGQRQYVGAPV